MNGAAGGCAAGCDLTGLRERRGALAPNWPASGRKGRLLIILRRARRGQPEEDASPSMARRRRTSTAPVPGAAARPPAGRLTKQYSLIFSSQSRSVTVADLLAGAKGETASHLLDHDHPPAHRRIDQRFVLARAAGEDRRDGRSPDRIRNRSSARRPTLGRGATRCRRDGVGEVEVWRWRRRRLLDRFDYLARIIEPHHPRDRSVPRGRVSSEKVYRRRSVTTVMLVAAFLHQRLQEQVARALVGGHLPCQRIADRDILDPLVGPEFEHDLPAQSRRAAGPLHRARTGSTGCADRPVPARASARQSAPTERQEQRRPHCTSPSASRR